MADAKASFARSLRAANKAPRTIQTYLDGLDHFVRFLEERGMPRDARAIRREHVETFLIALPDAGSDRPPLANRYRSLQQFWRWLVEEDELPDSGCDRLRCPSSPGRAPA